MKKLFGIIIFFVVSLFASAERPNIVLVLADDVGAGDISCYAKGKVPTPNLDRLAERGVRFTQARSACALCAPSRYSILSGNNAWRGRQEYGTWNWWQNSQFLDGQMSLAQALGSQGYHCAAFGKWNLGARFRDLKTGGFFDEQANHWEARQRADFKDRLVNGPGDLGFETSFISLEGIQGPPYAFFRDDLLVGSRDEMIEIPECIDYPQQIDFDPADYPEALAYKGKAGIGMPYWKTAEAAGTFLKEAQSFIEKRSKKKTPFFIYYAAVEAHAPWTVPETYLGKPLRGTIGGPNYLEMVAQLDMDVGALIQTLEETGELDNTVFVFTSDNGGLPFARDQKFGHDSSCGYRASKSYIYEGGLAIPMIVSWPGGNVQKGALCDEMVILQDLFPTLVEMADGIVPAGQAQDGVSIAGLLSGKAEAVTRTQPVLFQSGPADGQRYALREGNWKLVCSSRKKGLVAQELYNLAADRKEANDLMNSPEQKSRVEAMHRKLKEAVLSQCYEGNELAVPKTGSVKKNDKPNVIIFYIDDQEYSETSIYPHDLPGLQQSEIVLTPTLERLAKEGVVLDRAYVTSSVCVPSRYSLLTGKYAGRCSSRNFLRCNPVGEQADIHFNTTLEDGAVTLPKVLQQNGYRTGMVGKWHLGSDYNMNGLVDGEGNWVNFLPFKGRIDYDSPQAQEVLKRNYPLQQAHVRKHGFDFVDGLYWSNPMEFHIDPMDHNLDWMTKNALQFIEEKSDKPFFLYYAATPPHSPWTPLGEVDPDKTPSGNIKADPGVKEKRLAVYDRIEKAGINRDAQIPAYNTWLDEHVGLILDRLEAMGKTENTLVIYYSDNPVFEKGLLYERGCRVPAVIRWPGTIPGGRRLDSVIGNIDLFPTVLAAAGIPENSVAGLDGLNLLPLLSGKEKSLDRDYLFLDIGNCRGAVSDRFKYFAFMPPADLEQRLKEGRSLTDRQGAMGALGWLDDRAQGDHPSYGQSEQFFDLQSDPAEKDSLVDSPEMAGTLKVHRTAVTEWLKSFARPFGTLVR